ncbi:DNA-3-methyladenine glycosylase II [Saccharomycopsis crataegensis]|uniref:DNA-3-methyladenine glycosylase II n=1 Tax=Saccharomycopsis crataegensis TaxID=43959 RepID=A0AAV5QSC8_9ASCO|nr:DNA-3-methyladenine glycosylase II [Saccharomycopsis crataegensis]
MLVLINNLSKTKMVSTRSMTKSRLVATEVITAISSDTNKIIRKRTIKKVAESSTKKRKVISEKIVQINVVPTSSGPSETTIKRLQDKYISDFVTAAKHVLTVDPTLEPYILNANLPSFSKSEAEPFQAAVSEYKKDKIDGRKELLQYFFSALCRGLIGQQVSGAAARSIKIKIQKLYKGEGTEFPPPKFFVEAAPEDLRGAGLSLRKVEYMKGTAEAFIKNDTEEFVDFMLNGDNQAIIDRLVELKGIGEWSAQMFLIFGMKKLDIFAPGDLGIAKGASLYLKDREDLFAKLKSTVEIDPKYPCKWTKTKSKPKRTWIPIHEQYMIAAAGQFEPYRSVFSLLMWQVASTNLDVLKE